MPVLPMQDSAYQHGVHDDGSSSLSYTEFSKDSGQNVIGINGASDAS